MKVLSILMKKNFLAYHWQVIHKIKAIINYEKNEIHDSAIYVRNSRMSSVL